MADRPTESPEDALGTLISVVYRGGPGATAATETLCQILRPLLVVFARRHITRYLPGMDEEDLAHDAFLNILRSIRPGGTFDPSRPLQPFAFRILLNAVRDAHRCSARCPAAPLDEEVLDWSTSEGQLKAEQQEELEKEVLRQRVLIEKRDHPVYDLWYARLREDNPCAQTDAERKRRERMLARVQKSGGGANNL